VLDAIPTAAESSKAGLCAVNVYDATVIHGGEPEISESGSQSPCTQNGSLVSDKSSERKYSVVVYV